MLVYYGIEGDVEFYASTNGGYVKYIYNSEEISKEEQAIVAITGSMFNIILWSLVSLQIFKINKKYAICPILAIIGDVWYWYSKGHDYQNFIERSKIDQTYVFNVFTLLFVLIFFLFLILIVFTVFALLNEYHNIEKKDETNKKLNEYYIKLIQLKEVKKRLIENE